MKDNRVKTLSVYCPRCGQRTNSVSYVGITGPGGSELSDETRGPEKNAFVLCYACGAVNTFADCYGHLRLVSESELYLLDETTLEFLRKTQAALVLAKELVKQPVH